MLVVLMALVELGRSKVHKATRWFWLLFSGGIGAATMTACEVTSNNGDTVATTETVAPDAIQQCSDAECVAAHGSGWYCDTATSQCKAGDVVVQDAVQEVDVPVTPDVPKDSGMPIMYGPAQCTDAQCVAAHGSGWYCDTATLQCKAGDVVVQDAVQDVDVPVTPDVAAECEPVVAYGPPPCTSDSDCKTYGDQWYCGVQDVVIDSCGTTVQANRCVEAVDVVPDVPVEVQDNDCGAAGWYGPPPCTSDSECQKDYGSDWYCNTAYQVDGPCGQITYPTCEPAADATGPDTPKE